MTALATARIAINLMTKMLEMIKMIKKISMKNKKVKKFKNIYCLLSFSGAPAPEILRVTGRVRGGVRVWS